MKDIQITRNDSIQIEYNTKSKVEIITSIEWISDCEYVLTFIDIKNHTTKIKNLVLGKKIDVKIISTDKNSYSCQVNSEVTNDKLEFIKIK